MLSLLLICVVFTIIISALCSMVEAAVYAVPIGYVKHLAESGSSSGKLLWEYKQDMAKVISAILMVNTLSNTVGPSIAGWLVGALFGADVLMVGAVSVVFAGLALFFGEMLPKTFGVVYCRSVAQASAHPLSVLLRVFSPLIRVSIKLQEKFSPRHEKPSVSSEEMVSLADLGRQEGALDNLEGLVIKNVVALDKLLVRDILTPRVVVFRLPASTLVKEVRDGIKDWRFSRIPIYDESDPDHLTGYVTQRDVYRALVADEGQTTLKQLSRRLKIWPELMRADHLLLKMFDDREHICAVVDEHGALAGIITLEDILEEIVGREIVDEYDAVSDLRSFAKLMRLSKRRGKAN